MTKLVKVDSIMFRVKHLERGAKFYREVLCLERVWTDADRGMIGFALADADSEIVIHDDPDIPDSTFCFLVRDFERVCDDDREKGYPVLTGPFEVRTGSFAVLADPDGNEIPIINLSKFGGRPGYD